MSSSILIQVARQREELTAFLNASMFKLAQKCALLMHDGQMLDDLLMSKLSKLPFTKYLWVLDRGAHQLTATVSKKGLKQEPRGRDRAARHYMQAALNGKQFYLSDAYISRNRKRPSLTAVHAIVDEAARTIGFLGADYDLRELPHTAKLKLNKKGWQQMKGDPAIRQGLFAQQRVVSAMDENIDDILSLMEELIVAHGVFHAKLHFSSSRATLWLVDNPYEYQTLDITELTDSSLSLAFPQRAYFERAKVPVEKISDVFAQFKTLRFADENIYLRSASLNVVNETIGLNFSCDGSHYMSYDEFLDKGNSFWFGIK